MTTLAARRSSVVVAVTAAMLLGLSMSAQAGEITGTGEDTPIRSGVAASICAFSGLNDDTGFFEGRTQSWGQIPKAIRDELRSEGESPGTACRGNFAG